VTFSTDLLWLAIGFGGQILFGARFLVQWLVSERQRRSVVPKAFWYLSIGGGAVLLVYAIHQRDPVFIAGQATGVLIYSRNLMLLRQGGPTDEPKGA
jgi:lipid-A-disaccharide synthase-like uncharacterized protein